MRIRIDRQQDALLLGHLAIRIRQVKPLRVGIDFEKAAALLGFPNDAQYVHLIGLALVDQPSRDGPGSRSADGPSLPECARSVVTLKV